MWPEDALSGIRLQHDLLLPTCHGTSVGDMARGEEEGGRGGVSGDGGGGGAGGSTGGGAVRGDKGGDRGRAPGGAPPGSPRSPRVLAVTKPARAGASYPPVTAAPVGTPSRRQVRNRVTVERRGRGEG